MTQETSSVCLRGVISTSGHSYELFQCALRAPLSRTLALVMCRQSAQRDSARGRSGYRAIRPALKCCLLFIIRMQNTYTLVGAEIADSANISKCLQHTCRMQRIDWRVLQRYDGHTVVSNLQGSLLIHTGNFKEDCREKQTSSAPHFRRRC